MTSAKRDRTELRTQSSISSAASAHQGRFRASSFLSYSDPFGTTHSNHDATIHRSFVLSSDQAHALHPNYASKHEKNHQVRQDLLRIGYFIFNLKFTINQYSKRIAENNEGHWEKIQKLKPSHSNFAKIIII